MAAGALDGPFLEEKHDGRHIRITAPRSQESERVRRIALVLCVLLVSSLQSCGLAFMRQSMAGETTLSAPPSGKSLVNFHRPSGFGGAADFRIFDRENLIGNVAGGCLFSTSATRESTSSWGLPSRPRWSARIWPRIRCTTS